jgi:hypothetical protein
MSAPKVFLSHASEDKPRFIDRFAERLRAKGVDVWLDKWEMLPGDSLVDKLFEEGLKNADSIIIVLSKNSVEKRWVREELNASFVKRIANGAKIIPIVLDNCDVPEALKSIVWETISDTENYDESFERILASIFNVSQKPPIGRPPGYSSVANEPLEGLTKIESLVLKTSCEYLIENNKIVIQPGELYGSASNLNLPKQEVLDSIEVLESEGYLRVSHYIGGDENNWGCRYQVSLLGFERYCKAYVKEYETIVEETAGLIVNEGLNTNYELAEKQGQPLRLINHIIHLLEHNDCVKISDYKNGLIRVYDVKAKLRRMMQ